MFQNLGVQLYTIRDYMKDPEIADVAFAKLARLGYTEAHTAGCEFDPALFAELLKKHGSDRLSGIDPAKYQALLEDVEGLTDAT